MWLNLERFQAWGLYLQPVPVRHWPRQGQQMLTLLCKYASKQKAFSNLGHLWALQPWFLLIFSGRHSQVENVIFQLYGCQPQNGSDPWAVLDFLELEIYSELHSTLYFQKKNGCSFSTLILKAFISDAFWGHLSTKSQGQNLSLFCSLFNETFFFNSVSSLSAIISHRLLSH